ncbi:MAG: hypothetical protein KGJ59_08030 [Bacteroidota bacterium]|nr:hypothetical protein [Bacteroidota bacterium]
MRLFAAVVLGFSFICESALAGEVVLQNKKLLAAFNDSTGALTRVENKTTGWVVERRPELGASFRLFVPLPERRYNFVFGQKQKAVKVEKVSDRKIQIEWKYLKSEFGGVLDITILADVTLKDGTLTFNASLVNKSALTVETIDYPYFGDFNPPSRKTPMVARTMWYDNLGADEIYPHFSNEKGYWGDFYPTKTFDSDKSPFCLIQSPGEGVYIDTHDASQPYLMQYTFEQHPGVVSAVTNAVPQQDEIDGKPVHLEFRTCHFIYAQPHSQFNLVPVVIQCYKGGWQNGVDLYKEWRLTWFKQPEISSWAKDVNSWLEVQINSSEESYQFPYSKLVDYGKECAKNRISAIQLVGWNKGGQDRGNPCLDTDPHLGTWKQLHDAIAEVQQMGVKVILFGKFPWADKTTEWYKKDLFKYESKDPYGIPYEGSGDSYLTPTQLAAINNRRFAVMDVTDPAYRNIAVHEFKKVLALGAAGFLYDEVPTHNPVYYNFEGGHSPRYLYAGDEPLAKQLHAAADSVDKNFLFAGEGPQDWLMQYYPVSYFRANEFTTPVQRYIDPQIPLMAAVIGFDNREMLNLCLLDRYIISYEPYNFKGKLSDFPLTLSYGKKIDEMRKKYKEYLWNADFQSTKGATVTSGGSYQYPTFITYNEPGQGGGWNAGNSAYKYSVFVTSAGKYAVVVINQGPKKAITVNVKIPNSGKLVVATPENPDAVPTDGTIQIPARSAAVIMEE